MMQQDDKIADLTDRARKYAALSVVFDPYAAVKESFGGEAIDPPVAAMVMGFLRADCTIAADGKNWIMRQSPRDRTLVELGTTGITELGDLNLPDDPLATHMREALTSEPEALVSRIDAVLADPKDLAQVDVMARALELAGSATGVALDRLPALQGTLNRQTGIRRADEQLAQGYFGNDALRTRLGNWIDNPPVSGMARALYIRGIPGVGKSFLLTKLVQEARRRSNPIVLWLDFDRRGLNLVEPDGLATELARQLGNELPESAVELARLRAEDAGESAQYSSKRGLRSMSYALLDAMGAAVESSGRNVLLVLDTLEVLASYGATHPHRLFEFLDDLLGVGMRPMAIVAAGRGDALGTLGGKRVEEMLPLTGLPDRVARTMLAKFETPKEAMAPILRMAHGNPLILRLAAKLAHKGGAAAVAMEGLEGEPPEVAGGYLYRAILSRIDGDDLSQIANLGLVMERVDAGAIAQVIGPTLGLSITPDESERLFKQLATHHWLVEEEPGGWVRHRSDVRQVVLQLLYADRSMQVAEVNRRAADYLADRDPAAALYHRLQALGTDDPLVPIDRSLAERFSEAMIAELPDRQADAVLQVRGQRSRSGGAGQQYASVEPPPQRRAGPAMEEMEAPDGPAGVSVTELNDMRNLLLNGDIVEADALFRSRFARVADATSEEGLAALCVCWLTGRWSSAQRLFRQLETTNFECLAWMKSDNSAPASSKTLEAAGFGPGASSELQALLRLVVLEMRAEFAFDPLVAEFERDEASLRSAQLTYRDAKALRLTEGALAFALLAENRPTTISGGWRDALGASGTGMQDDSAEEFSLSDAMALRERHRIPADFAQRPAWDVAACLNPYAAPAATLVSLRLSPTFNAYAASVASGFGAMAQMPFNVDEGDNQASRQFSRMEVNVEQLGALGATADWLSAFAFFNQVSNAPLVARRAECWRRHAAGQWFYGANAPQGWTDPESGLDRGLQDWLERLAGIPESTEEAARQLLFWYHPTPLGEAKEAPPMGKRAVARLLRAMRQARRAARRAQSDRHFAAAKALVARDVGRAIAAPLAILAADSGTKKTSGPQLAQLASLTGGEFMQVMEED